MNVWAIANQKGGVGKTTTAVTLGGLASKSGLRTLLIDMDPHGSLTSYFGLDPDQINQSVYTLFQHKGQAVSPLIHQTNFDRLSLLPASTALATLDRQLSSQDGMGLVIKRALSALDGSFDHVLIDCPPMLGVLMVNALAACDQLIIPVQTDFLALKGLERMLRTLTMITRARKAVIPHTIVATMFDRRTRAATQGLALLHDRYSKELWNGQIPVDTLFREASKAGIPLPLMAASSRGSRAYECLFDILIQPKTYVRKAVAL